MNRMNRISASASNDRPFPPEAYECHDDVTPEAVEQLRQAASEEISAHQWKVVDGFGRYSKA